MNSIFNKLKSALSKTSSNISKSIDHVFIKKRLDDATIEELEDILISADIGAGAAAQICESLRKNKYDKDISTNEIKQHLATTIETILQKQKHDFTLDQNSLNVVVVCGVNGNGKTTTIGKMSKLYSDLGLKVAVAACDTFRAAAVEQIKTWTRQTNVNLYAGREGADPASVAFSAVSECLKNKTNILFIDTAGRLHNHTNLMQELAKINKVIAKAMPGAPHHSILVVDGTTGQNAAMQVEQFDKICNLTGLIFTKLDGTAKAGCLVGIVDKFAKPVHFIGIGESADDLKEFSTTEFAKTIAGL